MTEEEDQEIRMCGVFEPLKGFCSRESCSARRWFGEEVCHDLTYIFKG